MINKSISVVVPAYNEEKTINNTLQKIHDFLISNFDSFEIIAVNDGSLDSTKDKINELSKEYKNIKLIDSEKNKGKGFSVRIGVLSAVSDYVLISDADLSTPIEEIEKFVPFLEDGFDVVIGSRALKESDIIKSQGILRRNMGKIFNVFVQMILIKGIKDTQCGFKCFKREVGQKVFILQKMQRFSFDAEVLLIARKMGYSIKEVPIKWINRENSRVAVIKDSAKMFLDLFRIRINSLKGCYDYKI